MTRLHAEETYKCKLSSGREMAVIRQSVNNPEETRLKVTADRQLCHPVTSEPRRRKMKLILTCHAHMKFKPHVSIWLEWNNVKSRDSLIGPSSNGTYFPRSSSNNNNIHFKQKLESVLRSSSPIDNDFFGHVTTTPPQLHGRKYELNYLFNAKWKPLWPNTFVESQGLRKWHWFRETGLNICNRKIVNRES